MSGTGALSLTIEVSRLQGGLWPAPPPSMLQLLTALLPSSATLTLRINHAATVLQRFKGHPAVF